MTRETRDHDRRTARETANAYAVDLSHDLEHARDVIGMDPLDPSVDAIETLRQTVGIPATVGDVLVLEADVTRGRPRHGALRSDDHVSSLTLRLPLETLAESDSLGVPDRCPECGHDRATYDYAAQHHIAGMVAVTCPVCDHEHDGDTWG